MELAYATEEQIKEFEYKLYLHHIDARDIDFEYPKLEKSLSRENICAYEGDELVGFISFVKYNSNYVEIKRIWVEKEYRRKRIATQILNLLFDCKSNFEIYLKTYTTEGLKFFLWQGFSVVSINKNGSIVMDCVR